MKIPKFLIVTLLIVWPIIMLFLLTTITGKVCISYHGFALDQANNLYLGKDSVIEVRSPDSKALRTISPYTSRGYSFTVTTDDTIKISTGDFLYQTDLFGNFIDKKAISDYSDDELAGMNPRKFITADNTVYEMKNHLFRTTIYRLEGAQKVPVYQMPLFDYLIKLSAILCFTILVIVVPLGIIKSRKQI